MQARTDIFNDTGFFYIKKQTVQKWNKREYKKRSR
jgi:hypothetical protein